MIPITAEYDNFEVLNVIESQNTNQLFVVIKADNNIGFGQFLSEWKTLKKGDDPNSETENDIISKVVEKIVGKPGDDFILYTKITWNDLCRVNNEIIKSEEECKVRILWNINITQNVLSWDKSCSSTPGKKTFTIRINVLDVNVK